VNLIDYEVTSEGNRHYLHIPEVFMEDRGTFTVVATNEAGKAVHSAQLTVVDRSENLPLTRATPGVSKPYHSSVSVSLPSIPPPSADAQKSISVISSSVGDQLMLSQELRPEPVEPNVVLPPGVRSVKFNPSGMVERTGGY